SRTRIHGEIAAYQPVRGALLKIGERVVHRAPLDAGVVGHGLAHQNGGLIEQLGIADGVEPTALPLVADRVGLDLGPLPLDVGRAAQMNRLGVAPLHDTRVGSVFRSAVHFYLLAGRDNGIRVWTAMAG